MRRLLIFVFLLYSFSMWAQSTVLETIIVHGERIEPSRSMTVIRKEDLDREKAQTVVDVLRQVPGVEVVRQGGIGQTTSIFIRGARSEDTLVLIDGVEANDAMSPACGFDFSTMSAEQIERIEVYRGPQSVRFGAGALGGVINIITKEGATNSRVNYLLETGSYSSHRTSFGISGKRDATSYAASVGQLMTSGFSAASDQSGNTEADGAKIGTGAIKFGWSPNQTAKIETVLRATDAEVEIDSAGGRGGDDPNNTTKSKQLIAGVRGSDRFLNDRLNAQLGVSFSEVDRKGRNQPDLANTTDSSDHFLSESRKVHSDFEWRLNDEHSFRMDLSYRDESGFSDSSFNGAPTLIARKNQSTAGGALTYLFESPTWFYDIGSRLDQSSLVGNVESYRASLGRKFPATNTKAFVSYGTGFKLPSLYQLYSSYGDKNLKEENSQTLEMTVEQFFEGQSGFAITAFENRFRDLIDYDLNQKKFFNLSRAKSQGFDFEASMEVSKLLLLSGNYTYLETEDIQTGLRLLRRPQNVWGVSARVQSDQFEVSSKYSYRGERDDVDPTSLQRIQMKPYGLISLNASYALRPSMKFHARIENLSDEKYEEVAGYGTAERSFFVGLSGEL